MPTAEHEHYTNSMEKLTRDMCSTPLPAKYENDNQLRTPTSCSETKYYTFDDLYFEIKLELEKLRRIKTKRYKWLQNLINIYKNDRMLDKWENFERKTDEQDKCFLQQNIMELRKQLLDVSMKISNMEFRIKDKHQLEKNVQNVKSELDYIEDKKKLISEYNVKAHRLLSDSKYGSSSLKDSINDLYCIYDETHQKIQQQLTSLREALLAWSEFDVHMHELKTVLREDHESMGEDIAFTIKNITKYLPAKHHDDLMKMNNNSVMTLNTDHVDNMSSFLMNTLNVEGSLSDSGISDSGSEQDLCEREKRLVLLKKFARKLESILAPGSEALRNISKKIDEVEFEIKELQQTCHTIIKTGYFEHEDQTAMKKDKLSKNNFQNDVKNIKKSGSGDPGSDPGKGRSIFWRVLRAALPFHMAIVVLLCVACLLEPNCCDAINNLNLSLTPQLRYISGPPPT